MSSFLHRLAERAVGRASAVQPLVLPRYASPELGPPAALVEEEDAPERSGSSTGPAVEPRIQRAPAGTAGQGMRQGAVPEVGSMGAAPPGAPSTGAKGERPARRARAEGDPLAFEVAGESSAGMRAGAPPGRAGADDLLMGASAGESLAGAASSLAGARASFTDASAGSPAGAARSRAGAGAGSLADAGAAFAGAGAGSLADAGAAFAGAGAGSFADARASSPDAFAGALAGRGTAAPFAGPVRSPSAPEPRSESLLLPELEAPEPLAPEARAPTPPAQATTSGAGEPTIRITIGRVDVRAAPPPASPRAPAPERKPALSLEDYLASRQRRSR